MSGYPQARSEGIFAEGIGDELVVYVQATHMAYALSKDAASVWRQCDGKRSSDDIARRLGLDEARVAQALAELSTAELIEWPGGISRRALHKRAAMLGAATLSAPLLQSVAIPPAAAAASFNCADLALTKTGNGTLTLDVSPDQCPSPFASCYFLNFGQVGFAAATLTLTNNGGASGPLTVALTLNDEGFALVAPNFCNLASGLASGAHCTFNVSFTQPANCPGGALEFAAVTVSVAGVACLRLQMAARCPLL